MWLKCCSRPRSHYLFSRHFLRRRHRPRCSCIYPRPNLCLYSQRRRCRIIVTMNASVKMNQVISRSVG